MCIVGSKHDTCKVQGFLLSLHNIGLHCNEMQTVDSLYCTLWVLSYAFMCWGQKKKRERQQTGPTFKFSLESLQLQEWEILRMSDIFRHWATSIPLIPAVWFNTEAVSTWLACSVHVDMDGCARSVCEVWFVFGNVSCVFLAISTVKFPWLD